MAGFVRMMRQVMTGATSRAVVETGTHATPKPPFVDTQQKVTLVADSIGSGMFGEFRWDRIIELFPTKTKIQTFSGLSIEKGSLIVDQPNSVSLPDLKNLTQKVDSLGRHCLAVIEIEKAGNYKLSGFREMSSWRKDNKDFLLMCYEPRIN